MEEFLKPVFGWVFLWIKFRNKTKVHSVLKGKYNNSYSDTGAIMGLELVGVILIILLFFFLIAAIIGIFIN